MLVNPSEQVHSDARLGFGFDDAGPRFQHGVD
jgi:hypothetical protein